MKGTLNNNSSNDYRRCTTQLDFDRNGTDALSQLNIWAMEEFGADISIKESIKCKVA